MKGKDLRMTSQAKRMRNEALEVRASPIQSHSEDRSANHTPSRQEIRLRPFEVYLETGGLAGNGLDDWLQTERELERAAPPKAQGSSIKRAAQ
jgi:hypothetical protein